MRLSPMTLRALVTTALLATCGAAAAMTAVERDFPALVDRAEQIVVARVAGIAPGTNRYGGPVTLVSFDELTVLKGQVGARLILQFSGGSAEDGALVRIPDLPAFTVGERAVLFVAGNGRDICPLVGLWQGRFQVLRDEALGVDVVERYDGARVVGLEGGKLRAARRGAEREAPIALGDFEQLIREEMAHPSGTPEDER